MPGRLRKLILEKGAEVAEAIRRPESVDRMPQLNTLNAGVNYARYCKEFGDYDSVKIRIRNNVLHGNLSMAGDALLLGCHIHEDADVTLGPGSVAYDCDFYGKVTIGSGCSLFCCKLADYMLLGDIAIGDNTVLANCSVEKSRLYGRDGYQVYQERGIRFGCSIGHDCVLASTSLKLFSTDVRMGNEAAVYDANLELGWNNKVPVRIGNRVTMSHGYRTDVKVRQMAMFDERDPEYATYRTAGLGSLVADSMRGSTYIQLMCHDGTLSVEDDVNVLAPVMLHAQKQLCLREGCTIAPAYATESSIVMQGRQIRLGPQSLVVGAAKTPEHRQHAGSVTATGVYNDIITGWKSRLAVVTGDNRWTHNRQWRGITLGDSQTGYM